MGDKGLLQYYQHHFPYKEFCQWLCTSFGASQSSESGQGAFLQIEDPNKKLVNREISMTLQKTNSPEEIYLRYQSYETPEAFRKDLISRNPKKIDIGAVYNAPPRMKQSYAVFEHLEKELVFDIDLTDYDDVRKCCQAAQVCEECWRLCVCAAKIINSILVRDFGWEKNMFVFSGRRGIHVWCCDQSAKQLTTEARTAIASYMSIFDTTNNGGRKLNVAGELNRGALHPSTASALDRLKGHDFPNFVLKDKSPNSLDNEVQRKKILQLIKGLFPTLKDSDSESIKRSLSKAGFTCADRWAEVERTLMSIEKQWIADYIVLYFMYPRLDVNVTRQRHHLLKAPFCVHPGTRRVCVPFFSDDLPSLEDFRPLSEGTLVENINSNPALLKGYTDKFAAFIAQGS